MTENIVDSDLFPKRNDPCPCGGGKKSKNCCQISKYAFVKKPIQLIESKNQITDYANGGCLAGFTKDCSDKISGEHYISKAILKLISDEKLNVTGWPYSSAESVQIGINNLTVNCLCTRHNSMLSPLDDAAANIFKTFLRFTSNEQKDKRGVLDYCLYNYWDFERWMIKTLVMTEGAGLLRKNKIKQSIPDSLKMNFLKVLFSGEKIEIDGAGFYFIYEIGKAQSFGQTFSFASSTSSVSNDVEGCTIILGGFNFVFSSRKLLDIDQIPVNDSQYRPWRLIFNNNSRKYVIDFSAKNGQNYSTQIQVNPHLVNN